MGINDKAQQSVIVTAVRERGYFDGWTDEQIIVRQLVKLIEELGELCNRTSADDTGIATVLSDAVSTGDKASTVFRSSSRFTPFISLADLQSEIVDMIVPIAVMAHFLGIDDVMTAAAKKALGDIERGVR